MEFFFDMEGSSTMANSYCEISAGQFYEECVQIRPFPEAMDVIFPNLLQTILQAPPGYVGIYADAITKGNLRFPLNRTICDILEHFGIHVTRLNPQGWLKLTNFIVMCKAYNCEVSVDLFRCFFEACHVGDWVTFRKRGNKRSLFVEPVPVITNWQSRFIFVSQNIIPIRFPPFAFRGMLHATHRFPNEFPAHLESDPSYQRLCRYPARARTYEDEVLFRADLAYMWEDYPHFPQILVNDQGTSFLL